MKINVIFGDFWHHPSSSSSSIRYFIQFAMHVRLEQTLEIGLSWISHHLTLCCLNCLLFSLLKKCIKRDPFPFKFYYSLYTFALAWTLSALELVRAHAGLSVDWCVADHVLELNWAGVFFQRIRAKFMAILQWALGVLFGPYTRIYILGNCHVAPPTQPLPPTQTK